MKSECIKTWSELAGLSESYMRSAWIFRGVPDATHPLVPGVGRPDVSKDLSTGVSLGYSPEIEKRSVQRFKREARPQLAIEPSSELDWLSVAQHHGLPTRLLDWTESPLIAAYFALRSGGFVGKEPKDAAIYGMECPPIVEADEDLDAAPDVTAYYPRHLTPRITAQRGLFTYHKAPNASYEPLSLVRWVLPSSICFTLKVILSKAGFNEASMFPDLDGIARHAGWQLKWRL